MHMYFMYDTDFAQIIYVFIVVMFWSEPQIQTEPVESFRKENCPKGFEFSNMLLITWKRGSIKLKIGRFKRYFAGVSQTKYLYHCKEDYESVISKPWELPKLFLSENERTKDEKIICICLSGKQFIQENNSYTPREIPGVCFISRITSNPCLNHQWKCVIWLG